jgi:hypothetical protein
LAGRQDEADRIAESIGGNADLRLRPPRERTIASPSVPLLGAGCTLVRPHNREIDDQVLKVRISPSSVKSRFQTPFFAHIRKRLDMLFHVPNSSGKSRYGAPQEPATTGIERTDDLSSPCRPCRPSCLE